MSEPIEQKYWAELKDIALSIRPIFIVPFPMDERPRDSGAGDGIRTRDPLLGKQLRYHCATPAEHFHPTA